MDELFQFSPEVTKDVVTSTQVWKVLSVEDDAHYQASLVNILDGFEVMGHQVQMLTASSAYRAAEIIADTPDLAVALLDVVMEHDEAGLQLVDTIRQVLGNSALRVILLTGQPGMAPFNDVMQRYDIDEYWQKTDITADKIRSVVAAHIRTWSAYHELESARKSLTMVVEASQELSRLSDLKSYSNLLLDKVAHIINAAVGGIICAQIRDESDREQFEIVSHSGVFCPLCDEQVQYLADLPSDYHTKLTPLIRSAYQNRQHQFCDNLSVLYFEADKVEQSQHFIMIVESAHPLSRYHINLLQVFSENVNNGFNNILLCNRLTELAYYDTELNIPNRAWLVRFINQLTGEQRQNGLLMAVSIRDYHDLVLSIPSEAFNDLLLQFYDAIDQQLTGKHHIARISDDSFAMIIGKAQASDKSIWSELDHFKLSVQGIQLHIEVNNVFMDLALLEQETGEGILHLLGSSVQHGRKLQRNFMEYSHQFRSDIVARHQLLQGLNEAIDGHQLVLVFQPKVQLSDLSVCGLEALLRWRQPNGELISPGVFIPVAEMSGLINKVDSHVFQLTVEALEQLYQRGIKLPISFNVTVADLEDDSFVDELLAFATSGHPVAPLLEVEITESQAMQDYDRVRPILKQLMSCGIGVSIDDFGTGYSSLMHITELGATHLKIDRAFVEGMMESSEGNDLVEIIIKLGKRFDFTVVAEGIETPAQCQRLTDMECQVGQGYLFGKPMEFSQLLSWLAQKNINVNNGQASDAKKSQ